MNKEIQRTKVIICDSIAKIGIDMLKEHCVVDIKTGLTENQLNEIIPAYDAAVVRSATQFPEAILDSAIKLKVIGRAGAGLDNIDVEAAKKRGITVVNAPKANSVAVAEHTFALMLALVRHLPRANSSLKENRWEKNKFMGTGLAGKTLGLVGFGKIASQAEFRVNNTDVADQIIGSDNPFQTGITGINSPSLNDLLVGVGIQAGFRLGNRCASGGHYSCRK